MKKHLAVAAALGLLLALTGHARSQGLGEATFKQRKARTAQLAYLKAMADAEAEYARKHASALKAYKDELNAAKVLATKAGDLQEANQIAAEQKTVEQAIKDLPSAKDRRPLSKGLIVHRAAWGLEGNWQDITKFLQSAVKDDRLVGVDAWTAIGRSNVGDPAFGRHKFLILEGSYGGKRFAMRLIETGISEFSLGKP